MAASLAAAALVGALVGFAGSQALDHSATLFPRQPSSAPAAAAAPVAQPAPAQAAQPAAPQTAPAPAQRQGRAPAAQQQPAQTGNPADQATQTAVQRAIQSTDDAQVKAVSGKDLSGLSAAATSDFATQQQSVTQDLLDNGVTDIKLVNVEWGPITVNGSTATATNFETWSTTYSDGSTEQSRDRNVYTLVQQDGQWVVQADDHPDAQASQGQGMPSIPNNLLPPGLGGTGRGGNTSPSVQVQP